MLSQLLNYKTARRHIRYKTDGWIT